MDKKNSVCIRIKLKSFDSYLLDISCKKIIETIKGITMDSSVNVVSLPTKRKIYCILRSPHVDKDSREHFEIRIHKRILEIEDYSNNKISEKLSDTDLPSGIMYELSLFESTKYKK